VVLLRKVIGDVLRARRLAQRRTLREVSTAANVSLGYLSEIERGHKEASSELLAAICDALGTGLSDVLSAASSAFALVEQVEHAFIEAGPSVPAGIGPPRSQPAPATREPVTTAQDMVTDGEMTIAVRSDGPLRTTLTARRAPGPRTGFGEVELLRR
jgi:transcriptional regulator with XRE-family HTH domain